MNEALEFELRTVAEEHERIKQGIRNEHMASMEAELAFAELDYRDIVAQIKAEHAALKRE